MKCLLLSFLICITVVRDGKTMKALVLSSYSSYSYFRIRDIPTPTVERNQMLINIKAIGINPMDAHMRSGNAPIKLPLPAVLGKEVSGVVEEVGDYVTTFKKGDRVFCEVYSGGYAEYVAANQSQCYHLPERLSFSQGAAIYVTYFAVYRAFHRRAHIQKGDTVLIHGASGTIGTAACQMAKDAGAIVVATVGNEEFGELMRANGADYTVLHRDETYLLDALYKAKTSGFDIILEILSKLDIERDKKFLAAYGRIVVMGNRVDIEKSGRGTVYTCSIFKYTESEKEAAAKYVLERLEKGIFTPVVAEEYKLEDVHQALFYVLNNNYVKGKLVFKLDKT